MLSTLTKLVQKRKDLRNSGDSGFTLIELLVVILIIGILSAVVVVALSGTSQDAKAKGCAQDASTLYSAIANYQTTGSTLPVPAATETGTAAAPLQIPLGNGTSSTLFYQTKIYAASELAALVPQYISKIPTDVSVYYLEGSQTTSAAVTAISPTAIAVGPTSTWVTDNAKSVCTPAGI